MAKQYIESAIRGIEVEMEQKLKDLQQQVIRDKIVPFNAEIDKDRDEALRKLQEKYNEDRGTIITASEDKKKENETITLEIETKKLKDDYKIIIDNLANVKSQILE